MSANQTDTFSRWLIAITVIFVLSITLIVFASSNIAELSIQQKIQYRNQAFTTAAIVFLASAVLINTYYAAKRADVMQKNAIAAEKNLEVGMQNAKFTQDRLISERLMAAITQLGNDKIETRTSAIYVLERVAQDFPQEHWTVMEILTAFVRENAPIREESRQREKNLQPLYFGKPKNGARRTQQLEQDIHKESLKIPKDIQAILTVIGRRNSQSEQENQKLDLRNIDIRQVDLMGANLQRADLL
jgi:hypothetical protein